MKVHTRIHRKKKERIDGMNTDKTHTHTQTLTPAAAETVEHGSDGHEKSRLCREVNRVNRQRAEPIGSLSLVLLCLYLYGGGYTT